MIGVAIKGLLGRKLRATLTAFAIVLGVAMISGAFILTDTLGKSFDSIFNESYKSTDAVISSKPAVGSSTQSDAAPAFAADVLTDVQALPGVHFAQGSIEDNARLVSSDGDAIGSADEGIALGIPAASADQSLNPMKLVTGQWPTGDGQIAIDKSTADRHTSRSVRRSVPSAKGQSTSTGSAASSASVPWARSARRRSPSSTFRRRRACSTSSASST